MSGAFRRLLGLDTAAVSGQVQLVVRWLDGSRPDKRAEGRGVVRVTADTVAWQLAGHGVGERPWRDVTSWAQTVADDDSGCLAFSCAGEFQLSGEPAELGVAVTVVAPASSLELLTRRAIRFLPPERISTTG